MFLAALLAVQLGAPSAEQYYENAIEATRGLPQPNLTTYDVHLHMSGMGFALEKEPHGKAGITIGFGPIVKSDASFPAAYRRSDDLTAVETPKGWGVISSPIFNPTWSGIEDWIRYGFNGRPDATTASPVPALAANALPVIGDVRAMGVAFYNVSDGGAATCADGDAAHRVHLTARRDPLDHPLTDAVIDERTNHFCAVRFQMRQSVVALGYTLAINLDMADVDGESLVRSGKIDWVIRAVGFGVKHVTMTFVYDGVAFPPTLPGGMFPTT